MSDSKLKIDLLYFEGCPNWITARERLTRVIARLHVNAEVNLIRVETQAEAERQRFTGSPTLRVNGHDLFPVEQAGYALGCRVYLTPEGLQGAPNEEMILKRLHAIL